MRQTYLRIDDELHRRLRHEAAEDDVSLNQCIVNLLQEALEVRHSSPPKSQHTEQTPQAL
jgi:hypothetical protein